MGLPLVLTDIRGCREVVRPGVEGLLVPAGDADRLAEAIASLLEDPATRGRMGSAAHERAVVRFDERRVIATVVESSRRLLARRGLPTGGSAPMRIRPARPADAASMARIHREALPEAFLSTLGERFLRRLYAALAAESSELALVAENGHGVVGFAAGSASVGRFYRRFVLRHGAVAALSALPALTRPGVLRRVRETASHPANTASLPPAELLSIAVEPGYRSEGVGKLLAEGIVEGLAARGAGEVKVVVAEDNAGANRFYERLGFRPAARISVHGEVNSNVWVIRCPR
jgi:ribosomal protein S18 acetylase RimI-like enzyme